MDNFNILVSGGSEPEDLVDDGWTDIIGKLLLHAAAGRRGDDDRRGARRRRWSWPTSRRWSRSAPASTSIVDDPATAEALKPYYRQFCKRPCFHDEYLDTFNRPNVTLVDTDGRGVERHHRARRRRRTGVEYELDCLIFATGFEVGTDYTRRAGYELFGRDGVTPDREVGRRRVDASTACTAAASRTASSSASCSRASR